MRQVLQQQLVRPLPAVAMLGCTSPTAALPGGHNCLQEEIAAIRPPRWTGEWLRCGLHACARCQVMGLYSRGLAISAQAQPALPNLNHPGGHQRCLQTAASSWITTDCSSHYLSAAANSAMEAAQGLCGRVGPPACSLAHLPARPAVFPCSFPWMRRSEFKPASCIIDRALLLRMRFDSLLCCAVTALV